MEWQWPYGEFMAKLGFAILLMPFWGFFFCRMIFEWLRISHLLLGEQFGPYKLYNPKSSTNGNNDEKNNASDRM